MPSFDCSKYWDILLPFIMPENVEFFISLFSLAFKTTLEIHCKSNWHLSYIIAPNMKHNDFTVKCLFCLEFHLILNGDLMITVLISLSQGSVEYFSKLKGRQKPVSLFNDTFLFILPWHKIGEIFLLRFVIKMRSIDTEQLLLQGIGRNMEKYKIQCLHKTDL